MLQTKAPLRQTLGVLLVIIATVLSLMIAPAPVLAEAEVVSVQLQAVQRERLRIDGTDEMFVINQQLKQRYEEQFPGAKVEVETSGTEAALAKLLEQEIDLAAIGRPLTAAEKAAGLLEIPVSREKIAIIIGQDNPFQGRLSLEQVSKIFRGEITDWAEVGGTAGPIRVIDRPENSDTRLALQQYPLFQNGPFAAGDAVVRVDQDETAEVIRELGADGISYAIASQLTNQNQARTVPLMITLDVLPSDTFYPYAQARSYAYRSAPGNAAQAFLGLATTKPGQVAIASAKLAEAKAIAAGEPLVPPAKPLAPVLDLINQATPEIDEPAAEPVDESNLSSEPAEPVAVADRREAPWWLLLLLLPLGGGLYWWIQRLTKKTTARITVPDTPKTPAEPVPVPVAPSSPATALADFDLEEDWGETAAVIEASASSDTSESMTPELETVVPEAAVVERIEEFSPTDESEAAAIEVEEAAPELPIVESATIEPTIVEPATIEPAIIEPAEPAAEVVPEWSVEATPEVAAEIEIAPADFELEEMATEFVAEPQPDETTVEAAVPELTETAPEPPAELPEEEPELVVELADQTAATHAEVVIEPELIMAELTSAEEEEFAEPEFAQQAADRKPIHMTAELVLPEPPVSPQPIAAPLTDLETEKPLKQAFLEALRSEPLETASLLTCYSALAAVMCQRLLHLQTPELRLNETSRWIGEISAEYLPGPHLENSLVNLGLLNEARQAMAELGLDLQTLFQQEEEPGLGEGGLGRLMVCALDALATAKIPAIGYGIRYEYGIFDQEIQDGWQVEVTDTWLRNGNPWEVERRDKTVRVPLGGTTEAYIDEQSRYRVRWLPAETIPGIPYDTPIPGYRTGTVNWLRLWKADTPDNLCKVLYPVDIELQGKELRLKQQFFLVSCALQDALRLHEQTGGTPETLPDRVSLQLNDTDPTLAVAELMRLLVDEQGLTWETAWSITQQTLAYTNHSLMPETLDDCWSVAIFGQFLPRHLEIIYEINSRFLETVKSRYPGDDARLNRMSLIDEQGERYVRLTYLACMGCHAVNGVSKLHTELLKQTIFRDFYQLNPDQFSNQTNGITPRRFLLQANSSLAALITRQIGEGWITNLDALKGLEPAAEDATFRRDWRQIKLAAKRRLAAHILQQTGIEVDPNSLFDVQAMLIHEYKRQHLNLLHILTLYHRIKTVPGFNVTPRTFIFAGKAAPDYFTAKLIIKLIHAVANLINSDPAVQNRLKVVFLKDLNIKSAQLLYPAADVTEHLSLAGTEAADTGNLIFCLNGALLLGTPDGTNLEIFEAVGPENSFSFGLPVERVEKLRRQGYQPLALYQANADLKAVLDLLTSGRLAGGDPERFRPIVNLLLYSDQYLLLADYAAYIAVQEQVSRIYRDGETWTRRSILTTARLGRFSADQMVQNYSREIWQPPTLTNTDTDTESELKKPQG